MAWVKVPPEHHPIFLEALPKDRSVETMKMFGGIAAKVNGHIFAGLFGRSVMLALDGADKERALALEGAGPFDPMGDGRMRSDKVMLPEAMMEEPDELRGWIARAFAATAKLPPKSATAKLPPRSSSGKPTAKPAKAKPETKEKSAVKPAKGKAKAAGSSTAKRRR